MPSYQYTARDGGGMPRYGATEAASTSAASAQLREQGLWVTGLTAVGAARGAPPAPAQPVARRLLDPIWTGVSLKDLAFFFRQFATLIDAGMPLFQSLATLQAQTPNKRLRAVIGRLAAQVERGGRLSEAFREFPAIFSPLQITMIEAGEAGGMMDVIMNRLADYLEAECEIRREIRGKTLYPKLIFLGSIFIPPVYILFFHGPWVFLQYTLGQLLPGLLPYGVLYLFFRYLFQYERFRAFYDDVKSSVPFAGPAVRKLTVGKLTRALAMLYGAGVSLPSALGRAAAACGNARFERSLKRVTPMLLRGEPLSAAMATTGLFSPAVLGMVQTGEHAGKMDSMLGKIAEYQESEANHGISQLMTYLEVAFILGGCLIAGAQIVGFWQGYGHTVQNLINTSQ
jgi:type IV pilus assembly protein PilC